MTTPNVHLSIIVFRGSPLDYQQYRHTSFWVQSSDQSPPIIVHITGTSGIFEFEVKEVFDPTSDSEFAKKVEVGFLTTPTTSTQLWQLLEGICIDNQSREFNCQTWIGNALKTLKDDNCLSASDYERGLGGMVDAIAEAEDEEE